MWSLEEVESGYFKIRSVHSGKVSDVMSHSQNNGARIIQYHDNGGSNLLWQIVDC